MKSKKDIADPSGLPVEIEPVSFRPGRQKRRLTSSSLLKWLGAALLSMLLMLLGASAWFVFTARQVVIRVDPEPDRLIIRGGLIAPKIGDDYLMRPGDYVLEAVKECYQPLQTGFVVSDSKKQEFKYRMDRQPGRLSFRAHQVDAPEATLPGTLILLDGQALGRTPLAGVDVAAGRRSVTARAPAYLDLATEIEVAGCGQVQQIDLALIPGWAEISLQSEPAGASVLVDGESVGRTPATFKLMQGEHDIELQSDQFKPWRTRLRVAANQPQNIGPVSLQPADGELTVRTSPADANVMVDRMYAGQTPLKLTLAAGKTHLIQVSRSGYETAQRRLEISSGESQTLNITLKPKMGVINFVVKPTDAGLFVDGRPLGRVPMQLDLPAVEHQLELKKEGYRTYRARITPRPGFPQEIKVTLARMSVDPAIPAGTIKAGNGYELKLIQPGVFSMGSSRREQGRRSNETLRRIKLQRAFYMGVREVTNKEIREFLAAHNSGSFAEHSLNQDPLPAVDITWEQAALFCNWLSVKDSLKPVYVAGDGGLVAEEPVGNGYRLPTEAEWEYCARFSANRAGLKYPWGNGYPPPPNSGNYADASARDLLADHLDQYNDGFAVSAPPAKFEKNALELYDMGGNVAEWCHDYYSIYPYDGKKVYIDPMGPGTGKYHVIKGASWMQAGIGQLRLSYRDYSDTRRADLGFRVARYVE